jgi:hemoglobin
MKDLENREDLLILLTAFYDKVRRDEKIGAFFNDIVEINWDEHIPRIADFWDTILFDKTNFKGNPMIKHMGISDKKRMEQEHFDRWIELFHETINELFAGQTAEKAKVRAVSIATMINIKVIQHHAEK